MRYKVVRCRLSELLAERGMTQDDLATKLEIRKSQISEYCNTKGNMSLILAKTIASELNIHIDDLYEWERPAGRSRK